jgi:hypothetical protein
VLFAYDPIRRVASQVLWIEDPFPH